MSRKARAGWLELHNKPQTEDALHKSVGRFLYIAFVESCQNLVYHLDKCGVYEGLWEKCNMDEKEQRKTDEKEKCFVIMPISDPEGYKKGHFRYVYEDILIPAIEGAGFEAKRADDDGSSSMIQVNIIRDIIEAPMAVCDLSTRNPNVLFELGIRQAFDLPVVLVQEQGTQRIFDINTINTIDYRKELRYREVMEDRKKIQDAISATRNNEKGINSIIRLLEIGKARINNKESGQESLMQDIKFMMFALSNQIDKKFSKYDGDVEEGIKKREDKFVDYLNEYLDYKDIVEKQKGLHSLERAKIEIQKKISEIDSDRLFTLEEKFTLSGRYRDLLTKVEMKLDEIKNWKKKC